jgi:hypothetical protein
MKPVAVSFAIILLLFVTGCGFDGSYMGNYTVDRPQISDIVGTYKFEEQTIHESLQYKEAASSFITLNKDGTFIANNVLNLAGDTGKYTSKDGLINVSGKWQLKLDSVQTSSGNKKAHWGVALTPAPESISFVGFLGNSPPYKLIINYDDPDLNQVMLFSKKP